MRIPVHNRHRIPGLYTQSTQRVGKLRKLWIAWRTARADQRRSG